MAEYDKDAVQRRLRRIEGQIKGIQRMIDEERGCNDILIQVSAVRSAVNRVGGIVLENHLKHCMTKCKGEESEKEQTIDALIETMIGFLK
jgi:DNA-binding FrmR family transcriptional regulator